MDSFQENFDFSVDGTDQDLKISICGEVIGPTFRFEPPLVEFGTVSLGFEESKNCRIINTSLVPMEFELELTESASLNKVGLTQKHKLETKLPWKQRFKVGNFTMNFERSLLICLQLQSEVFI